MDEPTRFFDMLFGDIAEPKRLISVWRFPSKQTTFHETPLRQPGLPRRPTETDRMSISASASGALAVVVEAVRPML